MGGGNLTKYEGLFETCPGVLPDVAGDSSGDASGCGKRSEAEDEPSEGVGVAACSAEYSEGAKVGSMETAPDWANAETAQRSGAKLRTTDRLLTCIKKVPGGSVHECKTASLKMPQLLHDRGYTH